jgi:hypothetical protein
MKWVINGKSFEMDVAAPEETVKFKLIEQWEIINKLNPGAMMEAKGMAHQQTDSTHIALLKSAKILPWHRLSS